MTVPKSYFNGQAVQPFHIEYAKDDEKRLRAAFDDAGVRRPWFAGEMRCGERGETRKHIANCDLTEEQYAALEARNFEPLLGTRHSSATSSIPLPPRRRDPSEAYTLQHNVKVTPPLHFKGDKGPG